MLSRQVRWLRGMVILLVAFCLSMGGAFIGVRVYMGLDQTPAPPDTRLIGLGERLREMQAEVVDAAERLAQRLPAGQTSVDVADARWIADVYLAQLNYLRLRLEDPNAFAGLPQTAHEAAVRAVDALRHAAREPTDASRRAHAFALTAEAAQAVEEWIRGAGVGNYVRLPAMLPEL